MKGEQVPDADHVARLCGGSHLDEDGRPQATAFLLKQGETYLSVNWLENLNLTDREQEIAEIRRVMATKRKKVGAKSRLAVFNVGNSRQAVFDGTSENRDISVVHEPEESPPVDPSHSGIYNLPPFDDDTTAAERLANAIGDSDIYPAT